MNCYHPTIVAALLLGSAAAARGAVAPDAAVVQAEDDRAAAIAKASAATVAVFDAKGEGGGSGVLISPDGFAVTNFHVTAPCGAAMKCGLNDGKLYDAVIVGIDPVGDVALIQLFGRDDFPVAEIGDSDKVRVGDWCFAAGNPFLLADDFTPSISYGLVSGIHRYQYPAGTLLEYTDCIQTDAAIIVREARPRQRRRRLRDLGEPGDAFRPDAQERPHCRSCDARRHSLDRGGERRR